MSGSFGEKRYRIELCGLAELDLADEDGERE